MDIWPIQISVPLALAVMATLGYMFGRRTSARSSESASQPDSESRRAQAIACELEKITLDMRKSIARHHASVTRFKDRVNSLSRQQDDAAREDLCHEAEDILSPTAQLATQLATAYDEIRRHSSNLTTFTESSDGPRNSCSA